MSVLGVRAVGALLLGAGAALTGILLSRAMFARTKALARCCAAFERLRTAMMSRRLYLRDALVEAAQGEFALFADMARELGGQCGARQAYERALAAQKRNTGGLSCLQPADLAPIERFMRSVGSLSADDQTLAFDALASELAAKREEALGAQNTNGRLYATLGILSGIALSLLAL